MAEFDPTLLSEERLIELSATVGQFTLEDLAMMTAPPEGEI